MHALQYVYQLTELEVIVDLSWYIFVNKGISIFHLYFAFPYTWDFSNSSEHMG